MLETKKIKNLKNFNNAQNHPHGTSWVRLFYISNNNY